MEEAGVRLRFIKKLPRSAGPPSWKLSIQHSVVSQYLQHLVNTPFDLASSEHAQQTWQGCIAPRRNKERNEYILQGWKLFGEAHNFQAGDQVSFELVQSRRLVVTCIQPGKETALLVMSPDLTEDCLQSSPSKGKQPAKVPKSLACTTSLGQSQWRSSVVSQTILDSKPEPTAVYPGRTSESGSQSNEVSSLDGDESMSKKVKMGELCSSSPQDIPKDERMAQRVQSWMSLHLEQPPPKIPHCNSSPLLEEMGQAVPLINTALSSRKRLFASATSLASQATSELPGIFDDIAAELDDVVPDAIFHQPLSIGARNDGWSPVSRESDNVTGRQEAPCQASFRAFVNNHQGQLDKCTREALQATMRMETMVMDSYNPEDWQDACHEHANMFKHLSDLKGSLWQLLVVANKMNTV